VKVSRSWVSCNPALALRNREFLICLQRRRVVVCSLVQSVLRTAAGYQQERTSEVDGVEVVNFEV
jgi:hypothetical protein